MIEINYNGTDDWRCFYSDLVEFDEDDWIRQEEIRQEYIEGEYDETDDTILG